MVVRRALPRPALLLILLLAMAIAAALSAFAVWTLKPAVQFAPLSIPDQIALVNGQGQPPRIPSGSELRFTAATWCNALDHPAKAVVAISMITTVGGTVPTAAPTLGTTIPAPPPLAQSVLSGLAVTLPSGCTPSQGLNLALPTPLRPGFWRMALTIVVTDHGKTQSQIGRAHV